MRFGGGLCVCVPHGHWYWGVRAGYFSVVQGSEQGAGLCRNTGWAVGVSTGLRWWWWEGGGGLVGGVLATLRDRSHRGSQRCTLGVPWHSAARLAGHQACVPMGQSELCN